MNTQTNEWKVNHKLFLISWFAIIIVTWVMCAALDYYYSSVGDELSNNPKRYIVPLFLNVIATIFWLLFYWTERDNAKTFNARKKLVSLPTEKADKLVASLEKHFDDFRFVIETENTALGNTTVYAKYLSYRQLNQIRSYIVGYLNALDRNFDFLPQN